MNRRAVFEVECPGVGDDGECHETLTVTVDPEEGFFSSSMSIEGCRHVDHPSFRSSSVEAAIQDASEAAYDDEMDSRMERLCDRGDD